MRAVIVGSGRSAEGLAPKRDTIVIAVNGAIEWLRRVDHWFSEDASVENKRRFALHESMPGTQFHVAGDLWLPLVFGETLDAEPAANVTHWRSINSHGTAAEPKEVDTPNWWLWHYGARYGINKFPGCINSGNSAWGALGLAWHLGIRDVALAGVDADQEPRIEGGVPGNLSHLPRLFKSALPDMRVVSCGHMGGIPQMSFREWSK